MVTDPIGDFLTRIRNGYLARKEKIDAPYSKMNKKLADILAREGYVEKVAVGEERLSEGKKQKTGKRSLIVTLKYSNNKPAIEKIERVSKPGLRVYVNAKNIPHILNGYGQAILSTSKGLMTDKQARKQKMGGEILCHMW